MHMHMRMLAMGGAGDFEKKMYFYSARSGHTQRRAPRAACASRLWLPRAEREKCDALRSTVGAARAATASVAASTALGGSIRDFSTHWSGQRRLLREAILQFCHELRTLSRVVSG